MNIYELLTAANQADSPALLHTADLDGMGRVGAWVSIQGDGYAFHPVVKIWSDFDNSEGRQEVCLFNGELIEALRDFLNEHFPKGGE